MRRHQRSVSRRATFTRRRAASAAASPRTAAACSARMSSAFNLETGALVGGFSLNERRRVRDRGPHAGHVRRPRRAAGRCRHRQFLRRPVDVDFRVTYGATRRGGAGRGRRRSDRLDVQVRPNDDDGARLVLRSSLLRGGDCRRGAGRTGAGVPSEALTVVGRADRQAAAIRSAIGRPSCGATRLATRAVYAVSRRVGASNVSRVSMRASGSR